MTRQLSFKAQRRGGTITAADRRGRVHGRREEILRALIFDFLTRAIECHQCGRSVVLDPGGRQGYKVDKGCGTTRGSTACAQSKSLPDIMLLLTERALNERKYLVTRQPDKAEKKIF